LVQRYFGFGGTTLFDEFGHYCKRIIVQDVEITALDDLILLLFDAVDTLDDYVDHVVYCARSCSYLLVHHGTLTLSSCLVSPKFPNYKWLCPFFGWISTNAIKRTFAVMTQYALMHMRTFLKKQYKLPNPALNVHHCDEPLATDTVYSDTPAINGGETAAQIFVGTRSYATGVKE
jgi:hypothetical protein